MSVQNVAYQLYFLKPVFNALCLISIFSILFLFLFSTIEIQNTYALPCMVLAAWCLLFSTLLGLFNHVPMGLNDKQGWFAKMRYKFYKIWFKLIVLIFVLVSIGLAYLTFKLIGFLPS